MKKMILGLGALTAVITPVAFAADCGGKSSKATTTTTSQTGTTPTTTPTTNAQQAQAVDLNSMFVVQGNTMDITAYEEYVRLQVFKKLGPVAFSLADANQEINNADMYSNTFDDFLYKKMFAFYEQHKGETFTIKNYLGEIVFTGVNFSNVDEYRVKYSILNDDFWGRSDSYFRMNGLTMDITPWSNELINRLKNEVAPIADWQHLTLNQYVKFFLIKRLYYEFFKNGLLQVLRLINPDSQYTIVGGTNTKQLSKDELLAIMAARQDGLFLDGFLHLDAPIPTA